MNEPQTASELMLQNKIHEAPCVLLRRDVQKFLLDVIDQTNFSGKMAEYVSEIKAMLNNAEIRQQP